MDKQFSPPKSLTSNLAEMEPQTERLFDAPAATVQTIVSRLHNKYRRRKYQTARENDGCRVWRIK